MQTGEEKIFVIDEKEMEEELDAEAAMRKLEEEQNGEGDSTTTR